MNNRCRTRQSGFAPSRDFRLGLCQSVVVPLALALAAGAVTPAYAQIAGVDGSNGGNGVSGAAGIGGPGSDIGNGGGGGGYSTSNAFGWGAEGNPSGNGGGGAGRSGHSGDGGSSIGGGRGANGEGYAVWASGGSGGAGGGLNTGGNGGGGGGGAARGPYSDAAGGGGGGGGGLGFLVTVPTTVVGTSITGGSGGIGGDGAVGPGTADGNAAGGGGGGGGGAGALVVSGIDLTNSGSISGGGGGGGGNGPENGNYNQGGVGGRGGGGAGVLLSSTAAFNNSGTVTGGDGSEGGVGIYADGDVTITNSGTISGGRHGGGIHRAYSVQFSGVRNWMNLETGSVIEGEINLVGNSSATIHATDAGLEIGAVSIELGSVLTLSTNSDFTVTGAIVGNGSLVANGTGHISLDAVSFGGSLNLANFGGATLNGDIAAADGHTYGSAVALANDLTLQSDSGSIIFASAVDGAHALEIIAENGLINFGGTVGGTIALANLTTNSATFSANGAINTGQLDVTTGAGAIVQGAAFNVSGSATFDAQSYDITLTNVGNSFGGAVSLTGNDVMIANSGNLQLASSTIGGNFNAQAVNATISQSEAIDVTGTTTLLAGLGDISLTDATNRFEGQILVTARNIAISGAGDLSFAELESAVDGNISLIAGGALTLPGAIDTTGDLLLAANGSSFATSGSLRGNTVALRGRDGITLTHDVTAASGISVLSSLGGISQAAGVITGSVSGGSQGDTTLTSLNMIDTLGDFTAGGDFALVNGRALTISGNVVGDGISLDVASGIVVTGLVQASGSLDIASGTDLRAGNGGTVGSIDAATLNLAGTLIFDRSDNIGIGAALTGAGTFVQEGAGNLSFNGNGSAFTGETEVRSGALIVGGAAGSSAVLGGSVRVLDGATLGGHGTLSGDVVLANGATLSPGSSIGTLSVQGDLTLEQGSNLVFELGAPGATFAIPGSSDSVLVGGDLTINGATLDVVDEGGMGPGLYRIFSYDGALALNNGGLILGAVPAGSGLQLQFLSGDRQINLLNLTGTTLNFWNANGLADATRLGGGSGTWSLTASNWTDEQGTLTASMQPVPGFAIFGGDAGTVTIDNVGGAVSATGLQFASSGYVLQGDALQLVGSGGDAPVIRVGDGSAADAGYVATINTALSGSDGFVKQGLGTLILGGDSAAYGGTARAAAGTLIVNGTLGGTTQVASGARLGGDGTMAAVNVAAGGILAPGNSIGTLSVGSLNLAAGSILEVEVDAAGNADRVNASGPVTIDGASMSVLAAQGNYAPLTSYTVLTSQSGITGTFADISSDLAFLTPTLSYNGGSVVLNMARNDIAFADVARTPNQLAIAGSASTLDLTNPLFLALVGQSAAGARAALDQLSGEVHPSARTTLVEDGRLPREAVLDRLAWAGDGSGAWGRLFGNWGRSDGNGNAADIKRNTGGLVMGVDASTPGGLRFGVAGGYTRTDADLDARLSEAKVKSGHVLGYAGARFDALSIRLGIGYSWSDIETDRSVVIGSLNDRLEAAYDGELLQAFGEISYDVPLGGGTLSPFAGAAVAEARTDGFVERGGPAALSVAKADQTVTYSTVGARIETAAIGPLSLRATGGWQHVWGDHVPASTVLLSGATTPAVIGGVPLSRNSGILEADIVTRLGTAATLTAGYSGRLGGSAQDHAARATLTIAF